MIRRLYPGGKQKACNFSYDDGVTQDVRLVKLLNKHGLKASFYLNSGLMQQQFCWTHPCGLQVKRLPGREVSNLYLGHEVASHSYSHPYMNAFSREEILKELATDRLLLQQHFSAPICGYAIPFHFYSDTIEECARQCGFSYARISDTDPSYSPWREIFRWKPGIFHLDPGFSAYIDGFLQTREELALCHVVGHSYDLEVEKLWDVMDEVFARISRQKDVWSVTMAELTDYLQAMEQAVITEGKIENHSRQTLWFSANGSVIALPPGQCHLLS